MLALFPLTLAVHQAAFAQATVVGVLSEARSGRPVDGAVVRVEGTALTALSDSAGRYRIPDVPSGPQVLRVQRLGFSTARIPLTVPTRGLVSRDIQLAEQALEMEGLTVTVDAVSRAAGELGTASVIDLEAIRHQTAASLAGVLELVPGVELEPPSLGGVRQFGLRAAPTSGRSARTGGGIRPETLASFGTPVYLDGVPVSNNANLQTLGPRGEIPLGTAAGGGIDLRRIPATTIERVEVIRGVPSARWGDLTQGAVIVETRAGEVPPEIAGLVDARTLEGSFAWGRSFGGPAHDGTVTFDAARTKTSPGVSDDDAYRLSTQLSHRAALGGRWEAPGADDVRLVFDTRFDFWQLFENSPPNPAVGRDALRRQRDWGLRLLERARLSLGSHTRLSFTGSFSATEQSVLAREPRLRGALPFTDRLTEGRQEGFFLLGPYETEVEVDGGPRLAYGRLELETGTEALGASHRLRLGMEPRREWNGGLGRQFEVERPPQVTFTGVRGFDRPRTYEDIAPLVTTGLYADDRLRIGLGGAAQLEAQAGVRLDLLHEGSSWFSSVRDAALQPRLNLELAPVPRLRLRGGVGRVAKAPGLSSLSPDPQYFDVVNVNQFTTDPAERLAVLTTFIRDPTNPDLGFIRATKAEAGVDLLLGSDAAISAVAFRDEVEGGVAFRPEPSFLLRERFALTDSIIGNGVKPEIIDPAIGADTVPILIDRPANVVEQRSRGLELVASLPELQPLRTRLQVTGSLVQTRQRAEILDLGPRDQFENFQLLASDERHPFWEPATEFGKMALLVYRLVHHQPRAGLALTAVIQHNVTDAIRDEAAADTLAFAGYLTRAGELVRVPESERGRPEFQDLRVPRGGFLQPRTSTPADWLLTFQVSKTLPLDGRFNFWAFNVMDNRGVLLDPDVLPRVYPVVRFGLEVLFPLGGLLPGGGGGRE